MNSITQLPISDLLILLFFKLSQCAHTQQMSDFNSIIQLFPIDCKAAWFNRPSCALFGGGFCEPLQPALLVNRQANLPLIAKKAF